VRDLREKERPLPSSNRTCRFPASGSRSNCHRWIVAGQSSRDLQVNQPETVELLIVSHAHVPTFLLDLVQARPSAVSSSWSRKRRRPQILACSSNSTCKPRIRLLRRGILTLSLAEKIDEPQARQALQTQAGRRKSEKPSKMAMSSWPRNGLEKRRTL